MDELVPVPVDLSELSDVAKNEVKNSKIKNQELLLSKTSNWYISMRM